MTPGRDEAGAGPQGPKPGRRFAAAALAAAVALGAWAFWNRPELRHWLGLAEHSESMHDEAGETHYVCPMHPHIVADRPGACPICNMALVAREGDADPRSQVYCATVPETVLGKVAINPTQRVMLQVATEPVRRTSLFVETFAVGKVTWDERRLAKVAAWYPGRIEKLHVDFTGARVERGQPLLEIYSPELLSTQREYLLATESLAKMGTGAFSESRAMSEALVAASRQRLTLWGVTEAQLAELERSRRPRTVFTVFAPAGGVVLERNVTAGQYVEEGTELYAIAPLDPIWVEGEVYENEVGKVPLGTTAVIASEAYPGREFRGEVTFVDPFLDPATRTVQVRVELPNPDGTLKPDMFVNVSFRGERKEVLAVSDSAVLITGDRAVAWVELEENLFEPRPVVVGNKAHGHYEVLGGLAEGEQVVTNAGYLIDSESQLRAASGGVAMPMATGGHVGHQPGAGGTGDDVEDLGQQGREGSTSR